jgi:hypothetical protein
VGAPLRALSFMAAVVVRVQRIGRYGRVKRPDVSRHRPGDVQCWLAKRCGCGCGDEDGRCATAVRGADRIPRRKEVGTVIERGRRAEGAKEKAQTRKRRRPTEPMEAVQDKHSE